jgi:hypothetical protein
MAMKSHIGLEHIRSHSEGRITHAVAGRAEEPPSEGATDKIASTTDASELVPVVVHVEKKALDELVHKNGH